MATVYVELDPGGAIFRTTNFPQIVQANGTNFPVQGLAYDGGSTNERAFWCFRAVNYGAAAPNVFVDIDWYADTATSGNCRWGVVLAAVTPESDGNIETEGQGTADEANDAASATAQRVVRHTATLSGAELNSLAADDLVWLEVYRDASDTVNDTMGGDAIVVKVTVRYDDQ